MDAGDNEQGLFSLPNRLGSFCSHLGGDDGALIRSMFGKLDDEDDDDGCWSLTFN